MGAGDLLALGFLIPVALTVLELNPCVELYGFLDGAVVRLTHLLVFFWQKVGRQGFWVDLLFHHDLSDVPHGITTQHIAIKMNNTDAVLRDVEEGVASN